jgi:hypothetical protein
MKKLLLGFVPITILAAISLAVLAISFDPFKADNFIKLLFFASLTAFIWGCGAIVFFVLNLFSNDRPTDSLRRGLFLALFVLAIVILRKQGILYWYTGFAAGVITLLIELWIYKKTKLTVSGNNDYY